MRVTMIRLRRVGIIVREGEAYEHVFEPASVAGLRSRRTREPLALTGNASARRTVAPTSGLCGECNLAHPLHVACPGTGTATGADARPPRRCDDPAPRPDQPVRLPELRLWATPALCQSHERGTSAGRRRRQPTRDPRRWQPA